MSVTNSTFVIPNYAAMLVENKEAAEAALVPGKVLQAQKSLEIAVLKLEEQQLTITQQMHQQFRVTPLNPASIYNLKNTFDGIEREKTFYKELIATAFGTVSASSGTTRS